MNYIHDHRNAKLTRTGTAADPKYDWIVIVGDVPSKGTSEFQIRAHNRNLS